MEGLPRRAGLELTGDSFEYILGAKFGIMLSLFSSIRGLPERKLSVSVAARSYILP